MKIQELIGRVKLKLYKALKALRIRYFMIKYSQINKIFTHLTVEEKMTLLNLARNTRGCFVEIGSYLGASACFISEGIQKSNFSGSKMYCVDTWQNDAMEEEKRDTYADFLENTKNYKNIITPLRGKSVQVAETFDKKIDFIFFDGDHSYQAVKDDVDAWLPKLNNGAIVVFHDTGWAEGVQKIIEEEIIPRAKEKQSSSNMFWARL